MTGQTNPAPGDSVPKVSSAPSIKQPAAQKNKKGFSLNFSFFRFKSLHKEKSGVETASVKPDRDSFVYVRGANFFLIVAVLSVGVYLGLDLTLLREDTHAYLGQVSITDSLIPLSPEPKARHDKSFYQEMIRQRNPFLAGGSNQKELEESEEQVQVIAPASDKMAKVMQSIRLVGISWSGNVPVAMIEQVETSKTFFLKEGQEINNLKVQTIDKEKVIVTYEGEEAPLF